MDVDMEDMGQESDSDQEPWNDECIDDEIKTLLCVPENGKVISVDMVAHMEYFYNTLQCSHKTVNPFDCFNSAKLFPALHFHLKDNEAEKTGVGSLFQ